MRVKTNKRMMSLIVFTAVLLCGFVAVGSQVQVFGVGQLSSSGVDFSGDWVLSERTPSTPAEIPQEEIPQVLLVIEPADNDFNVTRSTIDEDKIIESHYSHYTLDGMENINTGPARRTIRSTSKWDNGALVLEGSLVVENPDKDVAPYWKTEYLLSDDRTVLTVIERHPTPFGEAVISQIFKRR